MANIKTPKLMKQFNCEAKDVYLAILISQGLPRAEAYIAIFQPLKSGVTALVNRHIRENPQIESLITFLSAENNPEIQDLAKEDVKSLVEKYKDKDFIIAELIKSLNNLQGKDRADVLNRIADLQQMKKEENKAEEERVHYYLPLPVCDTCPHQRNLTK